jgi:Porin subfamily
MCRSAPYVRACSLYGAGFWYVPGTDTCVKIGAFARLGVAYGAGGGGNIIGLNNVSTYSGDFGGAGGIGTNMFNFAARGAISFDMRQQTEYGTLRSYIDMGVGNSSNPGGYGGSYVINPLFPSQQYGGTAAFYDRAFIQFAGFTAGRIRSFFDLVNPGAYSFATQRFSGDTGGVGIIGAAYTLQLGGGLSASFSLEDGGWSTGGRGRTTSNLAGGSVPPAGTDVTSTFGIGTMTSDVKGQQFFDPVFNLRLDQAWGFVGASFALHDASGGYYGTGYSCGAPSPEGIQGVNTGLCAGGPNGAANSSAPYFPANTPGSSSGSIDGHPADIFGWASTLGATWVNAFGLPGDALGAQGAYCDGAVGYCTSASGPWFIYGSGNKMGLSYLVDGIFNTNTPVYLTKTWSAVSYYEHVWTPQWRTSLYGGLLGTDWGSGAIAQICGGVTYSPTGVQLTGPTGFSGGNQGVFQNLNTPGFPTNQSTNLGSPATPTQINNYKGQASSCNPNSSWWQIGTRTMWNPVPDLDIGLDLAMVHLNTAFAGTANLGSLGTVFQTNAFGRPAGLYNITDQNTFAATVRIQRNFLY